MHLGPVQVHSAVEFRRYLHRFMLEFTRIETLAGVKRTVFNQYDSLVVPLQRWLLCQGVRLVTGCTVTALDHVTADGKFAVTALHCIADGRSETTTLADGDLVFVQNGSMTDASSLGSMTEAPPKLVKAPDGSWNLWEALAKDRPSFGNPAVFNSSVTRSYWASFTLTLTDSAFFDQMELFSGNVAGTCASTPRPSHRATASRAACPTSPACSCREPPATDRCRCRPTPATSPS